MNVLLVFLLLGASSQDATEDRWDVNAAYGPTSPLDFETTEGTWMNLDVSPDGTQIVFDLLGDLYVMGIEGGTATRLTEGAAFIKERSLGAGEIWMYHIEGADGLQVTEKTSFQKDAGEPSISPDGRYLYSCPSRAGLSSRTWPTV